MAGAASEAVAFGVAEAAGALAGGVDAHNATLIKNGAISKAGFIKAVGHGLSRAKIAQFQYGSMKGAFLSGFGSSAFSVGGGQKYIGAAKMVVVGGTLSAIGGGKFGNGAMASAFQYLFNDMMTQDEIDAHNENYRNPDKVALGNRTTAWHKENGEKVIALMKAGATVTVLPMATVNGARAAYAVGRYMYTHPNTLSYTTDFIGSYLPGIPVTSKVGYIGGATGAVYGYENFFK